ncbi:AraC family transcriptional regulator [Dyadobacter chenhuakuii]|uniref:AraC family transcriptional regulator n=1 Tax=Dyadobacter chenhuakuii TaxID=2909339 RepID=A0A9X1TRX9_9BACT|nr:helix-turn-helix domain-containing protein [Dyadobacter chenhuakuii]MCF2496733.1 AraC family transcriptional regulator [Dyadobacter chenhuakuii]
MIIHAAPPTLMPRLPQFSGSVSEPFEINALTAAHFLMSPARQENHAEMIWLTSGHFQVMIDMKTFEVSQGMILFQSPGQEFYVSSAADLEGLVIRFPVGFFPADINSPYPNLGYCISRIFEVDGLTAPSIISVIECMRQELNNPHNQQMEVLSGYLRIVLIYLSRQRFVVYRSSFKADMALLAKRFFELLERKYHVNKKVSEYADELAVTPNYLNQIVKQETGMSASANIRKRLLLQAKRMAMVEGVSMKAVAYKLGFEDTAHFSKFFKMGCGCNFTDYRKTCPN